MDIAASVLLPDVEDDTDLEGVKHTLSCAVMARQQPKVRVWAQTTQPEQKKATSMLHKFPIFCISDLHLGDKGPRDNFEHMNDGKRSCEFKRFLDHVEECEGRLFILGDLFELWQSNVSKVITCRPDLLDRFAKMPGGGARYILGNHDADLLYFSDPDSQNKSPCKLTHPFFQTTMSGYGEYVGDEKGRDKRKKFYFIHGHQADPYCKGDTPGLSRITAIYTGLKEDRWGSPLWNKYKTVEEHSIGRLERWSSILRRLCGKPGRFKAINQELCQIRDRYSCDVLVSGHTHRAGQLYSKDWGLLPIYNTGTWAENVCSFVVINNQGEVSIFDWVNGKPVPNQIQLTV